MRRDPPCSPAPHVDAVDTRRARCASDRELLKVWEERLRALLGEAAASMVDLHYSNGRLFLCPEPGADALDRCLPRLLANCQDWDMVVVLPPGSDPESLRAALTLHDG